MRIKLCFIAGIIAVAVAAGVFEALASPRKREETEEKKKEGKGKGPSSGDCDGL